MAAWMRPEDLDWDKWQGQVHNKMPYNAERYIRWRKFYPYCAGPLGDLCPHRLHPLMLATGNPEFPAGWSAWAKSCSRRREHARRRRSGIVPRTCNWWRNSPSGVALMMISGTVNQYGLDRSCADTRRRCVMAGNRVKLRPGNGFRRRH